MPSDYLIASRQSYIYILLKFRDRGYLLKPELCERILLKIIRE